MPGDTLETSRVFLRPLAETDAEGLHLAYGDAEAMAFWDFGPSRDVLQTAARIGRSLSIARDWHACWSVLRRTDDQFLGLVNFHHREHWNNRLELGWICAPPFWRQGYMTEAVGAVVDHCFLDLCVHRIEATISPDNVASRALAERLGFQAEGGLMRDRMLVEGKFVSVLMYALLRPDWRARREPA